MRAGIVLLYCLASFLGAFLLFSVQPLIGKMALPELGGTPAVWNTCLVYFQGMLLCGYLLAHRFANDRAIRRSRLFACYLLTLTAFYAAAYAMQPVELRSLLRCADLARTHSRLSYCSWPCRDQRRCP